MDKITLSSNECLFRSKLEAFSYNFVDLLNRCHQVRLNLFESSNKFWEHAKNFNHISGYGVAIIATAFDISILALKLPLDILDILILATATSIFATLSLFNNDFSKIRSIFSKFFFKDLLAIPLTPIVLVVVTLSSLINRIFLNVPFEYGKDIFYENLKRELKKYWEAPIEDTIQEEDAISLAASTWDIDDEQEGNMNLNLLFEESAANTQ